MKYEDIINYNYNGSKRKKHMSLYERSAMFSAYQALEGYSDDVKETERITNSEIYLDETKQEEINNKILYLYHNNLEGIYKYFIKDNKKTGGSYKEINSTIKKIDIVNMIIYFSSGNKINIKDIVHVEY